MTYKRGQSGNPTGRPRGVKDKRTIFRDMVEPSSKLLVQQAIRMALEGNESMLRLLLDRLLPAKPKELPIDICLQSDSFVEQSKRVLQALADGTIAPSEASTLMQIIASEAKIYESEVMKNNIEELKKRVCG